MSPQYHRIYVAGHRGMVGSALVRCLRQAGYGDKNIITASSAELDLRRQDETEAFVAQHQPDLMIVAAARVGGIHANATYPAEFLYDNLMISANLIDAAHRADVERLLYLGSSCIYPKFADQPIREDALLTGELEASNEAYAISKIAGLKLCQHYRGQYGRTYHSAMPCNLYGPGDNYHPENSHVVPALIRRFHEAKESGADRVVIWGTGTPRREFLHVDDLARACMMLCEMEDPPDLINVGAGEDISILDLARIVAEVVGFQGEITTDPEKLDGTPRKLMDSTRIREFGWRPEVDFRSGLRSAHQEFSEQFAGKEEPSSS